MAKRRIIVFGLGRFGSRLARELESSRIEVVAVDRNGRLVEDIKDDVSVAVQMDSTNEEAMLAQNVGETDVCVIAIGEGFESTLLTTLIAKIVDAHGEVHPELSRVQHEFAALRGELEPHMFKEEQVLFPAIRRLERSETPPVFPFGTVANPIRMMEHEHDNAGNGLAHIRELTCDYRAPADACNTYRAALDGLRELELDLHQHIHKENNVLFPRAMEMERSLSGR